jgi:hypothetical protein
MKTFLSWPLGSIFGKLWINKLVGKFLFDEQNRQKSV